jgi:hypothetical protein
MFSFWLASGPSFLGSNMGGMWRATDLDVHGAAHLVGEGGLLLMAFGALVAGGPGVGGVERASVGPTVCHAG